MLDAHAHVMQVKLCKANTRGVTQPAYTGRVRYTTGRVRYERDYKNRSTPSAQTSLSPSKQPADALLPHLGRPSNFTKKRERGRSHWRRLASRLKGWGFGFLITFSSLLSRYLIVDLVRSTWLMISFEIPSVNMLHW